MLEPRVFVPCDIHTHGPKEVLISADLGPAWSGMSILTKPDNVFWDPTDIQPEGTLLSGWVEATIYSRDNEGLLVLVVSRAFKPNPYFFNLVPKENTVEFLPSQAIPLEV